VPFFKPEIGRFTPLEGTMQNPTLLNAQEASRLIGMTRSELKRHTQQRTFGLRPKHCRRGECFHATETLLTRIIHKFG
jgi:hypothetical protein